MAEPDRDITVIEMREEIAFDMEPNSRQLLIGRLETLNVKLVTGTLIREVTPTGVKVRHLEDGSSGEFPADTVVIALGAEPTLFPVEAIEKAGIKVKFIGDAKEINGIAEAVRDGYVLGTSEGSRDDHPL